jgi:hypothetical protein
VSITLEEPRTVAVESFDQFAVDERYVFVAYLACNDASPLRSGEDGNG